ncbi:S-layer homology domain-containing protein, partial [bacterium]|nr:S-layer homology domain-containing protein [bacterium]
MDLSLRSIRKNIAALSVFALIASMLVVANVANAAATDVYGDIDGGEWYEDAVNWGLDNGVLNDTQAYFRPGDNASRAEFFTMVAKGAAIPETACDETLFPDLGADHWGCGYITAMANAGIVSGDGAGSATEGYVRPNDPINRAEAAKVIVEAYGLTGTTLGSDVFTDVDVDAWFDSYMGIANENCVFQGVDGGNTVEPGRNINRAESITVVQRGANPTTDCAATVTTGALTVALDGSTPDSV